MKKVIKSFLESKIDNERWHCQSSNITRISDNVVKFTEYNMLPDDKDGTFDGHYTFYVNIQTFDILAYQSSYYGSLTYTTPSKDKSFIKFTDFDKRRAESLCAEKLLTSYVPDWSTGSRQDKHFLFPSWEKVEPYRRHCLVQDYRGYPWVDKMNLRSEKDLEALSIIDPEFRLKVVTGVKVLSAKRNIHNGWIKLDTKSSESYPIKEYIITVQLMVTFDTGHQDIYSVVRHTNWCKQTKTGVFDAFNKKIHQSTIDWNGVSLSDTVKRLPEIFLSL